MVTVYSVLIFVIFRLFGIIDWSWIYVVMVPFVVSLIVSAVFEVIDVINAIRTKRAVRELQRMFDEWCKDESDMESGKDDE